MAPPLAPSHLAAGIDTLRQLCQQLLVPDPSCKAGWQLLRVQACQHGLEPCCHHFLGQLGCGFVRAWQPGAAITTAAMAAGQAECGANVPHNNTSARFVRARPLASAVRQQQDCWPQHRFDRQSVWASSLETHTHVNMHISTAQMVHNAKRFHLSPNRKHGGDACGCHHPLSVLTDLQQGVIHEAAGAAAVAAVTLGGWWQQSRATLTDRIDYAT